MSNKKVISFVLLFILCASINQWPTKLNFFVFFWEDNFCFRDNLHIRYLRMNLLSPCCRWWYLFIVRLSPTFGSLNCRKTHSENAFNCFLGYSLHKGAEIAVCKLKRFFFIEDFSTWAKVYFLLSYTHFAQHLH